MPLGPVDGLVAAAVARERFAAVMLAGFAGVAAALAGVGVYGVLSCLVARRTREIAIRMALGATRTDVLKGIVRTGLVLTGLGMVPGLVVAAAMMRFIQGMLFGITPLDPVTFVTVAAIFGLVATFASCVPGRRVSPWIRAWG